MSVRSSSGKAGSRVRGEFVPGRRVVSAATAWFRQNARRLPWREVRDPYAVWVSEIMLQQTRVATVVPYYERWMRELPDIAALASARSETLHKLWEGLGYYSRVRNMHRAAGLILERHGGVFPSSREELLALPGIGRYTAGAIASIAFGQAAPILDGNVIRVLSRIYGIDGNPGEPGFVKRLWGLSEELVTMAERLPPAEGKGAGKASWLRGVPNCSAFNQALMELGALVCMPKSPRCPECPLRKWCVALRTERVEELPGSRRRPATLQRYCLAFVVERRGRYLLRQRPRGTVNSLLWEFPSVETRPGLDARLVAHRLFGARPSKLIPLAKLRHSITRYSIRLEAHFCQFGADSAKCLRVPDALWCSSRELGSVAMSSAHRKIADRILEAVEAGGRQILAIRGNASGGLAGSDRRVHLSEGTSLPKVCPA